MGYTSAVESRPDSSASKLGSLSTPVPEGAPGRVPLAAGAFAALAGVLVLVGWAFDITVFKSLRPGWAAMMPNTAAAFLLAGFALALGSASSTVLAARASRVCSLLTGLLGAATLVEYAFGAGPRMAPETAACFVLLAAALWLHVGARKSGRTVFAAGLLGMLAAATGLTAVGVVSNFGVMDWAGIPTMAAPTALLFVLLGAATSYSVRWQIVWPWALGRGTTAVFVVCLVLMVFNGLYTSANVVRLAELHRQVQRRELVWQAASRVRAEASEAQSDARGQVITGDERFAKGSLAAQAGCREALSQLRRIVADDPVKTRQVARLGAQLDAALKWWQRTIDIRRKGALSTGDLRVMTRLGQGLMDSVDAAIEQVAGQEGQLTLDRQRETVDVSGFYHWVVFNGAARLGILLFALLALNRAEAGRKRADRSLRENESRYRALFEASADGILISDFETLEFLYANPAATRMLGYADEELRSMTVTDLHSTESLRSVMAEYKAQRGKDDSLEPNIPFLRKDRTSFFADITAVKLVIDGRLCNLEFLRDITARMRAEERDHLLSMAIEQTSENMLITDAEARILYVNPAFERATGYTRAEALGRRPSMLKSGRHDRSFYEEMWATLASGAVWRGRLVNRRKDGTLFEEFTTINPVRNADGLVTNYIAVRRDDSKERSLHEQLLQSQKMEAVGRLAGGIAHDFNNLLTAILGCAEMLAGSVAPGSVDASDVETILDAGRRAAGLTRQLLSFSRRQVTEMVALDLKASVLSIETLLRRTLGADLTLSLSLPTPPAWIKGDVGQIGQVLLNLSVNAGEAMPNGGALTISVSVEELVAPRVSDHDTVPPGSYALLRVADTGSGMDADVLKRILEPFFTTKELGTGLGLSTVYGIVKQCEGYLCVDSVPGRGSVFDLYFPSAAPPPAESAQAGFSGSPSEASETVLIVEDEDEVLTLAVRALESQGFTVLTARNAAEALAVSAAHRGEIQLLLTDVVMPGLTGPELARALLARRPKTRVLYMSGYADGNLATGGVLPDGVDLLQKPFQLAELRERVRRALDA